MIKEKRLVAFGPVPSRRLGKSLGINNIPPKICTYSCVYCQLGRTNNMRTKRKEFYDPKEIVHIVKNKVKESKNKKEQIDYLTFVPDGEPTLDINLGKEIELLRSLHIKIAVITNASLIWKKEVQEDLKKADLISIKLDTVNRDIWYKIDRPCKSINFEKILDDLIEFSHTFKGELITETMLVDNVNDSIEELEHTADFIVGLKSKKSYISVPIRPPSEKWVKIPNEDTLNKAYHTFKDKNIDVEYLIGYEGNAFASTGNVEDDILSITAVHPLREEGVNELLKKSDGGWNIVERLIDERKIVEVIYRNKKFYIRNLKKNHK